MGGLAQISSNSLPFLKTQSIIALTRRIPSQINSNTVSLFKTDFKVYNNVLLVASQYQDPIRAQGINHNDMGQMYFLDQLTPSENIRLFAKQHHSDCPDQP
jgi:hypothetical protein